MGQGSTENGIPTQKQMTNKWNAPPKMAVPKFMRAVTASEHGSYVVIFVLQLISGFGSGVLVLCLSLSWRWVWTLAEAAYSPHRHLPAL